MPWSSPAQPTLRCVVCRESFDFNAHETAIVLRHVAYGYDFTHDGRCLSAAQEIIFAEPGYDCFAFAPDPQRRKVLELSDATGSAAVVPNSAEQIVAGQPVSFEPLRCWALVEHHDGSQRREGLVWDEMWLDEPGGAEFPEARCGHQASLGYASLADQSYRQAA